MVNNTVQGEDRSPHAITKSALFSNLFPPEKKAVVDLAETITLKKGECLFSLGDTANHLYLLSEGLVRIVKHRDDGGDHEEIALFAPGDIIGDFDFARGTKYDAQAEAMEDSKLVMFPGRSITVDDLAFQIPHIVARLMLNSAAMVTGRIKATRKSTMENASWVQSLYRKAYEDPCTGLWKQTYLTDELERLLEDPMALIMLKPDRFKILVDALGHDAGDKAMVKIAQILKLESRKLGRGWPLRFKSNETGILINKCDQALAQDIALSLSDAVAALPPVSLLDERRQEYDEGNFNFSASVAWGIWPADNINWQSFFEETYSLLLDVSKDGGNKIVRYKRR